MALHLAALLSDETTAQAIQLYTEYDPQPQFNSGSMAEASPEVLERAGVLGLASPEVLERTTTRSCAGPSAAGGRYGWPARSFDGSRQAYLRPIGLPLSREASPPGGGTSSRSTQAPPRAA
jgi:hypothetical protein